MRGQDAGELEAALQTAWDPDTAAVYADLLTSRGDSRGELIAIDLALAKGHREELFVRKRELIAAWIGEPTELWRWRPRDFKYGLLCRHFATTNIHTRLPDHLAAVFERVGDRIGELGLHGESNDVLQAIEMIAARPLPWLSRLHLKRWDGKIAIVKGRWQALVAATPNLRDLTVGGTQVVRSPIHPSIHTLRLDGGSAIVIGKDPIPSVTTLDLAFRGSGDTEPGARLAALVNRRTFPSLKVLDLSRNGAVSTTTPRVLPFLDGVEHLDRFERVRVWTVADDQAATQLVGILERCPHLRIEIARMYGPCDGLAHPRLRVPALCAWPGGAHGRDALQIRVPGVEYGDELALSSLIDDLDTQFDDMPAVAQQAWLAFWAFLDGLGWEDDEGNMPRLPFPAATLLCALHALDGNDRADNVADLIRGARLPAGADVTIERYWGW